MDGFFAILVTPVIFVSGVASNPNIVKVKRGENVVILENKSVFNRVKVYKAGVDCKQQTDEICNWCSSEEKKRGCANNNCSLFQLNDGMESVFLTVLDASDGCYIAEVTANPVEKKEFVVVGPDQLVSPEPVESHLTKGTEPPDGGVIAGGVITGEVIAGVIIVVIIAVVCFFINRSCKKKMNITPREGVNGDEQATVDSSEMDEKLNSEDEDSLNEVLIMAQESGPEPGFNHNDDDDDDYCSSINSSCNEDDYCNNTNDYDSNYYSNDDIKNLDFDL